VEGAAKRSAIVVGAGVGGLAAGIALRRAGVEVTVLEKQADVGRIETGAGFVIWNNGMRALQKLGIAARLQELGAPLQAADWQLSSGRRLASWPVAEIGREVGAPAIGVRRTDLQSVLLQALPGDSLQLGVECSGFQADGDAVIARLSDGREERADVLIGADGITSTVRAQLHDGPVPPRSARYSQGYAVTDHRTEVTDAGVFREIDGRGLRFFLFPVGRGGVYWAAAMRGVDPDVSREPRVGGAAMKQRLLDRYRGWPAPVEELIEATDERSILQREIVDRTPLKQWGRGRVTLLGDAAHPTTPNLGQGACQAMEDAVVLAECVGQAPEVADALSDYEARRIPRTSSFVRRARMIGRVGRWRNPLATLVRDQLARLVIPGPVLSQHRKDMAHPL
jgi:2-polyprenyl-6-methoxyphenol hydroxylase-like FAD-dependent oxidoreductase